MMINAKHINSQIRQRNFLPRIYSEAKKIDFKVVLFLTFLHLPIGVVLYNTGSLGLIHPLCIFAVGIYWSIVKKVRMERIAYLIAYLVGCEVLWRMAQTPVFWEFGKYGSSLIMVIALLRRGCFKVPILPTVFIVLLIPAIILTLLNHHFDTAREVLSSNLSGPFFLFFSCWFFNFVRLDKVQIKRLFLFLFVPLLTVGATTLFYTVSNSDEIVFGSESNFATSGGFGPNQVSSMLGLGAFVGVVCFILFKNPFKFKIYLIIGSIFLAIQSFLTFSRGGIYNAVGGIIILVCFQFQNVSEGLKKSFLLAFIFLFFILAVFPVLDNYTGGKLSERFEDADTASRIDIIEADFLVLQGNPFLGVGVGESIEARRQFLDRNRMSHTEMSRLISEHGIFGILALFVLILIAVNNILRQKTTFGRALIAGVIMWSFLFMTNAGMRLAAPSFFLGISFINIVGFQLERRKNSLKNKINH